MKLRYFILIVLLIHSLLIHAQKPVRQYRVIQGTDTLFTAELPEFDIVASSKDYKIKYAYTKRLVLKSIALANYIRDLSHEIDNNLASLDKRKQKRKYLKSEKEKLFDTFSEIVKDMSENEGRVFNKLVYRQSGTTTYSIIEKFLGSGKAFMWQAISRVGGANLKETYDPYYQDRLIEEVMLQIDAGKLRIPRLPRNVQEYNNPVYD